MTIYDHAKLAKLRRKINAQLSTQLHLGLRHCQLSNRGRLAGCYDNFYKEMLNALPVKNVTEYEKQIQIYFFKKYVFSNRGHCIHSLHQLLQYLQK